MEAGSVLRRKCFWSADKIFLHGEYKKFYDETEQAYKEGTDIKDTQKKLDKLLKHAVNTTKFYSKYRKGYMSYAAFLL